MINARAIREIFFSPSDKYENFLFDKFDIFVLKRVLPTSGPGLPATYEAGKTFKELEKLASAATASNPITVGTPAQYRKWFAARKGKIVD